MRRMINSFALRMLVAAVAVAVCGAAAAGQPPVQSHPAHLSPAWMPDARDLQLRWPDADAVILFDSLIVSRDAAGIVTRDRHRAVMLFTDNAINRYGDPRLLWNAATQDLEVPTARCWMRDGTAVDTKENGINRTTPFALDLAPDYADWQETIVTHVGIEKGCVVELRCIVRDKATAGSRLSGVEIFDVEDPALAKSLEVRLAGGEELASLCAGGAGEAENPSPGVYRWSVRDIPGRMAFAGSAWAGDDAPVVCFSTTGDWGPVLKDLAAGFGAVAMPGATAPGASAIGATAPSPEIRALVDEAVKDERSIEGRIRAIHANAIESVRTIDPPYALLASPPRDASRIYASGYASPLDRAVLLVAMLRVGGFNALPVLVSAGALWPESVASPELMRAAAVAVWTGDGREMLLDPGAHPGINRRNAFGGRTLVELGGTSGVEHIAVSAPIDNMSTLEIALKDGDDGAVTGEGTIRLTGLFTPYDRISDGENGAERYVKGVVGKLFGGADLITWNIERLGESEAVFTFSATLKLPEKKKGERVYLSLPKPLETSACGLEQVHVERSAAARALRVEPSMLMVSVAVGDLAGWRAAALPAVSSETNAVGSAAIETVATGGRTKIMKTLLLDASLVRAGDYGKLRALAKVFSDDRFVLERR